MGVSMDPAALGRGANQFAGKADELQGLGASVAELTALRSAFAGAGEAMWPIVEARVAEIERRLRVAQEQTMRAGTVLGTAAQGSPAIDQHSGNAINADTTRM